MSAKQVTPTKQATWVENVTGQSTPTREATTFEILTGQATPTREATWVEKATGQATPTRAATTFETLAGKATPTREATVFERIASGGGLWGSGKSKARDEGRRARPGGSYGIGYALGQMIGKLAVIILVIAFLVPGLILERVLPYKRSTGKLWLYCLSFWSLVGGAIHFQIQLKWPDWASGVIIGGTVVGLVVLAHYLARRRRNTVQRKPARAPIAADAGTGIPPAIALTAQSPSGSPEENFQTRVQQPAPFPSSPPPLPPPISRAAPVGAVREFTVVTCPSCGGRLRAKRALSGKQCHCSKCQAMLTIP
jgi:hypothetical protein